MEKANLINILTKSKLEEVERNSYNAGRDAGRNEGYDEGYKMGYKSRDSEYKKGYTAGQDHATNIWESEIKEILSTSKKYLSDICAINNDKKMLKDEKKSQIDAIIGKFANYLEKMNGKNGGNK